MNEQQRYAFENPQTSAADSLPAEFFRQHRVGDVTLQVAVTVNA